MYSLKSLPISRLFRRKQAPMNNLLLVPTLAPETCIKARIGIESLHPDILWTIFNINADIWDDYPLKTARVSSQVCELWRNTMLASPGIWGKILKLAELQIDEDGSPWRDLVMERTGCASLSFEGTLSPTRVEWFLGFISDYWERIRYLDTHATGSNLVLSTNTGFMDGPSQCVLFHLPSVVFNLQAPWVHNLNSISLSNPLPTTRILECLGHMPHLEHAMLFGWSSDILDETTTHLGEPKKISLPRLRELHITHYYSFVATILHHIIATPLSSCKIFTKEDPFATAEHEEILSTYFQRQIDCVTQAESRVHLTIGNDFITAQLIGDFNDPLYRHQHSHKHFVDLTLVDKSEMSTYMSRFYSGSSTSGILELWFDIQVTGGREDNHLEDTFNSIVVNFLSAFSSVTVLMLSSQALFIVINSAQVNEMLFPSLEELILGYYDTKLNPSLQSEIVEFLDQRRSYGRPIKKLRIGIMIKTKMLYLPWAFLEDFDGMEIVFRLVLQDGRRVTGTYLCGSGTPDALAMIEIGNIDLSTVGIYEMERSARL